MADQYLYENEGIQFPSYIQNQSSNYPIVRLNDNHAAGLGFFTSVDGDGNLEADTNASFADAKKYLFNLPIYKRCPGYIAVVSEVTAAEEVAYDSFTESSDPTIYIYTGGYTSNDNVLDLDWRNNANWTQVEGGTGGGTVDIDVNGVDAANNLSVINFKNATNRTTVSYDQTGAADGVMVDVDTDFSGPTQNFYLGDIGASYNSDPTTALDGSFGVQVLNTGEIKVKTAADAVTTISGGSITAKNLTTSGNLEVGGAFSFGGQSSGGTNISAGSVTTSNISAVTAFANTVKGGAAGLKLSVDNSIGEFVKFGYNEPSYTSGVAGTLAGSVSRVDFNALVKFHNLPSIAQSNVTDLYAIGADGRMSLVNKNSLISGGNVYAAGNGLELLDSGNGGTFKIDTGVVLDTISNQTVTATKTFGSIAINGQLLNGTTSRLMVFDPVALPHIDDYEPSASSGQSEVLGSSTGTRLLYMVNDNGSNRNGVVHKGPSGSNFLNANVEDGLDIETSITSNELFKIAVRPRLLRKDGDDESMYDIKSSRMGVHMFTAAEISAKLTALGNTQSDITNQQTAIASEPTIFEWVREAGDFIANTPQDLARRRDDGVIMKAGFTSVNTPYSETGIENTRFRFSGKQHGVTENLTDNSEELGGTITFGVDGADSTYRTDNSNNTYAIQIGTGHPQSGGVGQRLNEVHIPNLYVHNFTVERRSYFEGTVQTGGDMSVGGNLTVVGTLDAQGGQIGSSTTIDTTGTLVRVGMPASADNGSITDVRDIGIVGVFKFTDDDGDDTLDNNEGQLTTFFRDADHGVVEEVFGRDASNNNYHKPWRLLTSKEVVNTGTGIAVADVNDTHYNPTALEVGGIKFRGYSPNFAGADHYSTKFINRVVDDIALAYSDETGVQDAWHGGGTQLSGALATADAIKSYVDTVAGNSGGFSSSALGTAFDFGIANDSEVSNPNNAYTEADAMKFYITNGTNNFEASPEDVGLALYEDSSQTAGGLNRPAVGWLPGSANLDEGTSVRYIMNKIFTAFTYPAITFDVSGGNAVLEAFVDQPHKYRSNSNIDPLVMEAGYNDYGLGAEDNVAADFSGTNGLKIVLSSFAQANDLTFSVQKFGVFVTKADGTTSVGNTSDVDLLGLTASDNLITSISNTGNGSVNKTIYLDLENGADGIGDDGGSVDLANIFPEGDITYRVRVSDLSDDTYDVPSFLNIAKVHAVRRRSFMFVSNLNVRASIRNANTDVTDDLDFVVTGNNYAHIDGTKSTGAPADPTGYSNKFMHYLLCTAASSQTTTLAQGDRTEDASDTLLNFPAGNGLLGVSGTQDDAAIDNVMIRHNIVGGGAGEGPNQSINADFVPFVAGQTDIRRLPGMLASQDAVLGSKQKWPKSTLTTSDSGFIYRAVPWPFAGTDVNDTNWLDSNGISKYLVEGPNNTVLDLLVKNSDGSVAFFTMTNQYGVDTKYVLFQSTQPGSPEGEGFFGNIVEK